MFVEKPLGIANQKDLGGKRREVFEENELRNQRNN